MATREARRFATVGALLVGVGLGAGAGAAHAQGTSGNDERNQARSAQSAPAPAPVQVQAAPVRTFDRWVDVQTANFLTRYRFVETSAGATAFNHMQDSVNLKARLKLDPKGRYSVNAGVATGSGFTGSWNNTGLGTGDAAYTWYLKQLFVAAAPVTGLELSYGGLGLVRGESTEITSYDNDGFVVGQRATVKRPNDLFFDEISTTIGYLGDVNTPSIAKRYRRLDEVNYQHVLVSKKATSWLATSADYTRLAGVSTVRAAAALKTKQAKVIDAVRYEQYARNGIDSAFGFALSAEKALTPRLTVSGGYADVDLKYGGLNADRFNKGRRVFGTGSLKLSPELSLMVFAAQGVNNGVPLPNDTRLDVVLTYNAIATLKRAGLLR